MPSVPLQFHRCTSYQSSTHWKDCSGSFYSSGISRRYWSFFSRNSLEQRFRIVTTQCSLHESPNISTTIQSVFSKIILLWPGYSYAEFLRSYVHLRDPAIVLRSRVRIATPIKIRLVLPCTMFESQWENKKSRNREISIMHGILGSTWPKMTLASYLKIKEETLLVYCLYFVGFLVRSLSGFDCEFTNVSITCNSKFIYGFNFVNRICLP